MASVAHVGDPVAIFAPPGFQAMALANGLPSAGLIVIAEPISGIVQRGSESFQVDGRGVAHIGDPVMVPMPPTLTMTGTVTGTLTFPPGVSALQGTIEKGSAKTRNAGRGLARNGDPVLVFFPPAIPFQGTIGGQPFAGELTILTPARGIIRSRSHFGVN